MARSSSAIKLAALLLSALFVQGCSHSSEMLWWDMMESHADFRRINENILTSRAGHLKANGNVEELSDSAIARLERLEALLFMAAKLKDTRNEGHLDDRKESNYYDPYIASDILVGEEPAMPAQHENSAEALRIFLEAHKRALESATERPKGDLDIFLFTHHTLTDPFGIHNHWETLNFYHVPVTTAIERLTRMKIAVRLMEHHVLQYCPDGAALVDSLKKIS